MKNTIFFLLCVTLCFFIYTQSNAENIDITSKEAIQYLTNPLPNMIFIDTREERQYNEGHIPGAISIDLMSANFEETIKKLNPHTPYVLYCNIGRSSAEAFRIMQNLGFTNMYHMKDGITGWNANNFPLIRNFDY